VKNRLALTAFILISATLMMISAPTKSSSQGTPTAKWGRRFTPLQGIVKITPLGSHQGEFCRNDRALLFEDTTGVRILWDPGRTIDEKDPRLGNIHVIVISSVHGDHIGDAKPNLNSPGTCAAPNTVSAAPNSVTAAIAATKNAAVFAGGEMAGFLGDKIADIRSVATAGCPDSDSDNAMVVPLTAPCTASLRPGGTRAVTIAGAPAGTPVVSIANFQAFHSNGIPASLVDSPGVAPGTTAYGGNDGGVIFEFTNGLHVYCTGDTGLTGDMKTIVKDYYDVNLVVANIGDQVTLGPREGAFAINQLLTPTSVIPEHINEAATTNGNPTGRRMTLFMREVDTTRTAVVVPLSGVTRAFDGQGRCLNCPLAQ
jgi:Beta-lactamase superfamily domain